MLTTYVGTYTIDIAKGLAETYMKNKFIADTYSTFNWTLFILVLVFIVYCICKTCTEEIKIRFGEHE